MKTNIRNIGAAMLGATLLSATAFAQSSTVQTTTTTSSAGTISQFSPDSIVIRSETSPEPVTYSYSKTTTYVDENGAPVSIETVKSGLPVTVFYTRDGDRMIASKVIVRKITTDAAPVAPDTVIDKKTTTTTTTTDR